MATRHLDYPLKRRPEQLIEPFASFKITAQQRARKGQQRSKGAPVHKYHKIRIRTELLLLWVWMESGFLGNARQTLNFRVVDLITNRFFRFFTFFLSLCFTNLVINFIDLISSGTYSLILQS